MNIDFKVKRGELVIYNFILFIFMSTSILYFNNIYKDVLMEEKISMSNSITLNLKEKLASHFLEIEKISGVALETPFLKSMLLNLDLEFNKLESGSLTDKDIKKLTKIYNEVSSETIKNRELVEKKLPNKKSGQVLQKLIVKNRDLNNNNLLKIYDKNDIFFKKIIETYGYYDAFLICDEGDIIYSYMKEIDLGRNLGSGYFSDEGLAKIFFKAKELKSIDPQFSGFIKYEPTYNTSAGFIGIPIYDKGIFIGMVAFQMNLDALKVFLDDFKNKNLDMIEKNDEIMFLNKNGAIKARSGTGLNEDNYQELKKIKFNKNNGNNSSFFKRNKDNIKYFEKIDFFGESYTLLLKFDLKNINQLVTKKTAKVLFLFLLNIGLIIFMFIYLVRKNIIKPIKRFNKTILKSIGFDFKGSNLNKIETELINAGEILSQYKKSIDKIIMIIKIDEDGNIKYINEKYKLNSNYSAGKLCNLNIKRLIYNDEKNIIEFNKFFNSLKEDKNWDGELIFKGKRDEKLYIKINSISITNDLNRVNEFMVIGNDVTKLNASKKTIIDNMNDSLTGLGNHLKFEKAMELNNSKFFTLSIIEIINFNIISSYYGHKYGKNLIVIISKNISKHFKNYGIEVFRNGNYKFTVLNTNKDIDEIKFQRICIDVIESLVEKPILIDGSELYPQFSFGISKGNGINVIENANLALSKAKDEKKLFMNFSDTLVKSLRDNIEKTKLIKEAIAENRILVYIQDIQDNRTNKTNKYECLVRLQLKNNEVLSPFFFLEASKKIGLYSKITKAVVDQSFDYFKDRKDIFSINLTIEDMKDEEFILYFEEKIKKYNIGRRLIVEIVESEGEENEAIVAFIERIKALRVKIAIDDFGTGYSNFNYLMELGADIVKIDGSLIKNIGDNRLAFEVVSSIVSISKKLDLEVVGEFVSNEEIYNKVKSLEIDYSQGYYIGKPRPIN